MVQNAISAISRLEMNQGSAVDTEDMDFQLFDFGRNKKSMIEEQKKVRS